ncbi:MAG: hypothetical protein PHP52_14700 [Bacteroidales bacterium]|nr:hypothetical protein [Bacteroidales bacterium]MDD4218539.1 hypothetical protein [Bacteroidales bacterium]MDY0140713.1 hypothetical protein [Bacteroidales bacterium]
MNEEQIRILEYLNQNAIGYNNRKSSTEIRDALNLESGGPTNEHVRSLIRDMIFNHGCLIGSLMFRKGYWIIVNEQELERVITHLNSRAGGVRERANILQQNWDNRDE